MPLPRSVRRWALVAGPAMVTASVLSVTPALALNVDPGTGPDYEMPFPCGQEWTGTTRANHSPSSLAVDFNRTGDLNDLTVSTAPGVVSRVADAGDTSYGRYVIVDHGDGLSTLYAHLAAVWTIQGARVDQGTILGLVGDTGGVSGPHLHFEERLGSKVQQPYFHRVSYTFGTTSASASCPDVPLAGDWNDDRLDEVAVFRRGAAGGIFRLSRPGSTVQTIAFGRSDDTPVVGDWDGNGRTDVGVRRQGKRMFMLRNRDGTTTSLRFGLRTDRPVSGDWNGDGHTDLGVWSPSYGVFRLLKADGAVVKVVLGSAGSLPVTGDWNGDGRTDVGVFDAPTTSFTLRTLTVNGTTRSTTTIVSGSEEDLPVTGDWNGDGVTDVGTWTPSTATFSLRTLPSSGGAAKVTTKRFGRKRY